MRIPALEAVRGLAAVSVVVFHVWHFHDRERVPQDAWLGFTSYGWLGVQVFFVLSGFVLYLPYARGDRPLVLGAYLAARARRIVPGLWVALAVSATVLGMWSWHLLTWFAFVNPTTSIDENPVAPAWTLAIEAGFYLLLPVLVWTFAKRPAYRAPILLGLVVMSIAARHSYVHGWPMTPVAYFDNFAAGVLAAIVVARIGRLPGVTAVVGVVAIAGGVAVWAWQPDPWKYALLPVVTLFALGLGSLAAANPPTPRALVWLGTISYGVYLWHWPVLLVATDHGLYELPDAVEIVLTVALSVLLGWGSWRLVEQRLIHRRLGLRRSGLVSSRAGSTEAVEPVRAN